MGEIIKKCLICGRDNCKGTETKISEFVRDKIGCNDTNIELLHCESCGFSFYNYRFSEEETNRLYSGYRGKEYQETREKNEPWYTDKVNRAINNNEKSLKEQQRVIRAMLSKNGYESFNNALDYGGNEGKTFLPEWGIDNKYLFDISNIPTISGVKRIGSIEELKKLKIDFVMCNMLFEHLAFPNDVMQLFKELGDDETVFYIEVPYEDPFSRSKFSLLYNLDLLFNPNFSKYRLLKSYLRFRRGPFYPMKEHINFFSVNALQKLVIENGFRVIDICENVETCSWAKSRVISCLFKKLV